jgi:hypothetical protein
MDHQTFESRTLSISINCNWKDLYEAIWKPEAFLQWASGLSSSQLKADGDAWITEGPVGPIRIRFTGHNDFGIMDHYVTTAAGTDFYIPLRVVQNGPGAEVMLTLFRLPGVSDKRFEADVDWVRRDLKALKDLIESGGRRF